MTRPFDFPRMAGHIQVESSTHAIKSISTQLVRVETITATSEGQSMREASEVQSIQAANGSVCKGMQVPLHMVLPRLFCAPVAIFQTFKVRCYPSTPAPPFSKFTTSLSPPPSIHPFLFSLLPSLFFSSSSCYLHSPTSRVPLVASPSP